MTLTMTRKVSECHAETVQFMPIEKLEDECKHESEFTSGNTLLRRGKKLEDNNNLTEDDVEYMNYRKLLKYEEAPVYLQHNPYIRDGYRKLLPTKLCWESIFWWTNETMNIWTHIFGFFLLLFLTINDLVIINIHATLTDKTVAAILFSCFLICMALSALYHTFSCRSEHDYNTFLMYDLFGIALSLLAIYTSGVYYAFWCHHIITPRTLELFVESLLSKAMQVTMQRNAKTLSPSHVKQCILAESRFDFLRDLVKNIPDVTAAEEREMLSGESSPNSSRFSDTSVPRRIAREDSNSSSSSDVKIQQIITAPKENFRRALSAETDIKPKNETITSETAIDLTKKEDKGIITANFYQETLLTDEVQHNSVIKVNPTYASPQPSTSSYINLTNLTPVENPEVVVPKAEHNPAFYIDVRQNTPPRTPVTPILNIDFSKNLTKPEIKVLDTAVANIVGVKDKKVQRQNSKSKFDMKKNNEAKVVTVVPRFDIDHLNSGDLQIDEDYDT